MENFDFANWGQVSFYSLLDKFMGYLPQLVLALVVLGVGFWISGKIKKLIIKTLQLKNVDVSLQGFLGSLGSVLFKILVVVSAASMVGIQTTSFIAILGAAGLAIGLALQGSLANFAGGVLVLLFKPFKVGDYIEAQGFSGTVKEIQIFNTVLTTPDNKRIVLPNGPVAGGPITNYSSEATRRVDFVFGIGYADDLLKAKELLEKVAEEDSRILKDPAPFVAVKELADSSVNFVCRFWVNASDYWPVYFETTQKVKLLFDEKGISIPFPQQDIHVFPQKLADKLSA